jgi:hypothetical protein
VQSGSQRLIRQKALSVSSKLSMSEVVRGALAQVGGALSWMGGSVRIPQQVWSVIRDTRHGHALIASQSMAVWVTMSNMG